ncbi:MAG: GNAT family N-acetyltransferase [Pseudomonadales bacterium]|nr:GNAT family N-acetyltransferase [Pseudomonadales bacterium]
MQTPTVPRSRAPALRLRSGLPADAGAIGRIIHAAFTSIAKAHGFPPDFPDAASAIGLADQLLADRQVYAVVAECDGDIVGSNFLHEHGPVAGIGPITIDPLVQDRGVGQQLMADVLARVMATGRPGVRLVQAAYHARSLALYARLGFAIREPLAVLQGPPISARIPGLEVGAATVFDVDACDALCRAVHGHDRHGEVQGAVARGTARIVRRGGRITGYTTSIAFFGHTVGESNDDLKALIAASASFDGPGFIVPMRNGELFRWSLDHGLRVVQTMTLMSRGLYNTPVGAFLPSVIF